VKIAKFSIKILQFFQPGSSLFRLLANKKSGKVGIFFMFVALDNKKREKKKREEKEKKEEEEEKREEEKRGEKIHKFKS